MTRSSVNGQKLAGPWLVDISSVRIETCFLQRKDEPSCRKRLRKLRQTILREVFLLGEETDEKVNQGDLVTRVKRLRDSSVQKRSQKKDRLTTAQISRYTLSIANCEIQCQKHGIYAFT